MVPIVIALVPTIVGSGLSLPHSRQRICTEAYRSCPSWHGQLGPKGCPTVR
jgi:hypothetical protein